MRRSILTAVVLGVVTMSSCSNNGEKAEVQEAQEVVVNNSEQTTTFSVINENSEIDWRASHLGGAQPRFGKIGMKSAQFLINNNELSNATVVMDMNSISVESFPEGDENIKKLEGHLTSDDFFDAPNHPTATFELTSTESNDGDFSSLVTGNLTIMEITKSITFKANISVSENSASLKSEDFAINRADWNLTYNAEGTEGVPVNYLIADDIGFTIDVTVDRT